MIIKKVTLRNFGPFLGEHSLDLDTAPGKPLILVGALNGGGKTTILEAARLTLYGCECGNGKLRNLKYKDYLRMCMNNSAPRGSISSTELTFIRNEEGVRKEIRVVRSWTLMNEDIDETVTVFTDGELDEPLSNEAGWNSYMSACLPSKLAHLFLFDGEQILHGGAGGVSPILKAGVHSLLGIEVIDKLVHDLEFFERRQLSELIKKSAVTELKNIEKEHQGLVDRLLKTRAERAEQKESLINCEELLLERTEDFKSMGGEEFDRLEMTKSELALKQRELNEVNAELVEIFTGSLNLEMTLPQLSKLRQRAKDEALNQNASATVEAIRQRDQVFTNEVLLDVEPFTKSKIIAWLGRDIEKRSAAIRQIPRLGLDEDMSERLKALMESAIPQLRARTDVLVARQAELESDIDAIEDRIRQVPEKEYIQRQEEILKQSKVDLDQIKAGLAVIDDKIAKQEREIMEKESELRAFKLANIDAASSGAEAFRLQKQTAKSLATLSSFKKKLITENIVLIQSLIEESLQRLLRKLSLVKKLTIDPDTFEIILQGPSGAIMPWQQMSAGEQQMVTTAIIWGLARASGHVFPMIVDTPLGRLDESHRGKLLDHYYPEASHQVVLLSTDKEIGAKELTTLQDHVTRTYLVRHNEQTKVSDLTEGYFN